MIVYNPGRDHQSPVHHLCKRQSAKEMICLIAKTSNMGSEERFWKEEISGGERRVEDTMVTMVLGVQGSLRPSPD